MGSFDWSAFFETTAAEIRSAFSDAAASIDHVGSTSVAGLDGKASLDVVVGLAGRSVPASAREAMRRLEFSRLRVRRSGRIYFARSGQPPIFVHVVPWGDPRLNELLRFRDLLRADAGLTDRYAALKREIEPRSANGYATAKRRFVAAALSAPRRRAEW
jgi:GrpB-like predicted nucleotidyltransferase (UPF0157 family)